VTFHLTFLACLTEFLHTKHHQIPQLSLTHTKPPKHQKSTPKHQKQHQYTYFKAYFSQFGHSHTKSLNSFQHSLSPNIETGYFLIKNEYIPAFSGQNQAPRSD